MTTATESAKDFWNSLPMDSESAERAQALRELVSSSRTSARAFAVAQDIYNLARLGALQISFVDISMLIYALLDNPQLIAVVHDDVQHMLQSFGVTGTSLCSWKYVLSFAPVRQETTSIRLSA